MSGEAQGPVGMSEIAALAGVAVSTVSRALSGAPGVSAAKRAKILEIARTTGYLAAAPSQDARVVTKGARIAAVIPEPDRWVFGSILAGIHDILTPAEASLTVYQGMSAGERYKMLNSPELARKFDAVILVPMPRTISPERVSQLGLPVVVAGSVVQGLPSVGIDDVIVGEKSTNYLINIGYRRIAYTAYTDHEGSPGIASSWRGVGFAHSMERAGLDATWQVKVPFSADSGRAAAEQFLADNQLPEAIVVCSDEMAAGMMNVFRRAGVRIPDDVALIGVDDHPIAELLRLTTIAQPAREQGRVGATLALQALGGRVIPDPVILPTRLVVRESTARSSEN